MMQTANLRNRDDLALFGQIDFSFYRRVSIQRQVRASVMVVVEVTSRTLLKAIADALRSVTLDDCRGFIKGCGYAATQ